MGFHMDIFELLRICMMGLGFGRKLHVDVAEDFPITVGLLNG